MPYVRVPKDFAAIRPKLVMGLTARQLVAVALAVAVCLPLYFFVRPVLGDFALWLMTLLAVPLFMLGFYKGKDGRPLEKVVTNYINVRYRRPTVRPYQVEGLYSELVLANQIQEMINGANTAENPAYQKAGSIHRAAKGRAQKGHTAC